MYIYKNLLDIRYRLYFWYVITSHSNINHKCFELEIIISK